MEAFLDVNLVRQEASQGDIGVPEAALSSAVAALSIGKHVLLSGGSVQGRSEVARILARASISARRSIGYLEAHMATAVRDHPRQTPTKRWGNGILTDAADASCWLVLFDVDLWDFSGSGLARALAKRKTVDSGSWRVIATSAGLARRPLHADWAQIASQFAWVDVTP